MRVIIEFDTSEPEQQMKMMSAIKGSDMAIALFEITKNMKRKAYDQIDTNNLGANEIIDWIFSEIERNLSSNGIVLSDLTC